MLPKSSTDLLVSEASDSTSMALAIDSVTSEPWMIETYAESLMDELFNDIENILDSPSKRNHHIDRRESIPVQPMSFKMPDVVLPSTVNKLLQSASPIKNIQTTTLVVNPPSIGGITTKGEPQISSLSKVIFMGLSLTLGTLGMVYLTESGLLTTINTQLTSQSWPNPQISSPVSVTTDPQLDLVNYMLAALTLIEQQGTTNITIKPGFPAGNINQTTAAPLLNTQPTATLPLPVAANNVLPATNQPSSPNVIERMYIPVDQSPVTKYQLPTVPPVPIPPKLPSSSSLSVNNLPINDKQPATKPIAETTQVKPNPVAVNPLPAKEPTNIVEQVSVPSYSAQLDGLLELGNKSAALFKVDGISHRISLGENIGNTGWILVEVSNGEAIIRRNGEVRSIYTGQKL
jgi:hypothetical protein